MGFFLFYGSKMNVLKSFKSPLFNFSKTASFLVSNTLLERASLPVSFYGLKSSSNLMSTFLQTNKHLENGSQLLKPSTSTIIPSRGMKVVGILKLRCQYCYYAMIEGVPHVFCDLHGRHKQRIKQQKVKQTWQLSHCTQRKIRPW